MSELAELIDFMCKKNKIHICIHDFSGLLSQENLNLKFRQKIHSTAYCDMAKSTPRGYQLCIRCKELANKRAVTERKSFWGICPNGLLEIVNPVVIDGTVEGIIYIGNILPEFKKYSAAKDRACRLTGVPGEELEKLTALCESDADIDYYIRMSEFLKQAICYMKSEKNSSIRRHRSIIGDIEEYINFHYAQNITLKEMAGLYFMNEKYLGRLFAAETGQSFHQYLNRVRLERAADLLNNTAMPILNIALECGYSNVTYFNRVFRRKFCVSPTQYRAGTRKNDRN